MLQQVMQDEILNKWEEFVELLRPAIPAQEFLPNQMLLWVTQGRAQVWRIVDAAGVQRAVAMTRLDGDSMEKPPILLIYALVGSGLSDDLWEDAWVSIYQFAKALKCSAITMCSANPTVIKQATRRGFTPQYTVYAKEV